MAKYASLEDEISTLNKLYFDLSEEARGYARQGDTETACALADQVKLIGLKLRTARKAKALQDALAWAQPMVRAG